MKRSADGWNRIGTLRDKVALVRCQDWILGFEARYVRQVGFPDLLEDVQADSRGSMPAHAGCGRLGDMPCSIWDLGVHLGLPAQDRAMIVLERPGGLVAFRCGEILAVHAVEGQDRLDLPAGLSAQRPGLFKSALVLHDGNDGVQLAYLLRASAVLRRDEIALIHQDWAAATAIA